MCSFPDWLASLPLGCGFSICVDTWLTSTGKGQWNTEGFWRLMALEEGLCVLRREWKGKGEEGAECWGCIQKFVIVDGMRRLCQRLAVWDGGGSSKGKEVENDCVDPKSPLDNS